jgi:integrase
MNSIKPRGAIIQERDRHLLRELSVVRVFDREQAMIIGGFGSSFKQTEGLVFTFKGRPIHGIKTAWRATIRRAGSRYFRFHDLRHTFNTRLMEAGVLQDIRKALMGHSSGDEVNSLYTHVELPVKREAIRKLEAWVEAQQNQKEEVQGEPHDEAKPIHRGEPDRGDSQRLFAAGGNGAGKTQ